MRLKEYIKNIRDYWLPSLWIVLTSGGWIVACIGFFINSNILSSSGISSVFWGFLFILGSYNGVAIAAGVVYKHGFGTKRSSFILFLILFVTCISLLHELISLTRLPDINIEKLSNILNGFGIWGTIGVSLSLIILISETIFTEDIPYKPTDIEKSTYAIMKKNIELKKKLKKDTLLDEIGILIEKRSPDLLIKILSLSLNILSLGYSLYSNIYHINLQIRYLVLPISFNFSALIGYIYFLDCYKRGRIDPNAYKKRN